MTRHEPFGDVELMLEDYFSEVGYVVTTTPADLKARLARGYVIRVARVGGGEADSKTADEPRVDVQVFALRSSKKPRDAHDGASLIRTMIRNLPAATSAGRLDSGITESGPTAFPWPDPEIVVVAQVFRLATRR